MVDFPLENAGAVLALLRLSRELLPTRHLVVTGLYRYIRNPMYVAVVGLIAGQALLLGNRALIFYAIIVWMAFQLFVLLYEEPVLRRTYAAEMRNSAAVSHAGSPG